MTMTPTVRIVGVLAAIAFAGQFGLAAAADEPKPKKEKAAKAEAPATGQPGGGIQSNKAKASESPRLTKGMSCAGDTPQIKKITPDEAKAGDKITITGEHFGAPGCVSGVSFGPGGAAKFTQADDTTVTAVVPAGAKGRESLTVTGFTGTSTKMFIRK